MGMRSAVLLVCLAAIAGLHEAVVVKGNHAHDAGREHNEKGRHVSAHHAHQHHKHEVRSSGHASAHTKREKRGREEYRPIRELCPFGYGTGCSAGSGTISGATKSQVANILKGILSNISNKKGFVQISEGLIQQGLHKAENEEARKALVLLLSAFHTHKKEATSLVLELTGEAHGPHVTSLASMSKQLSKMAPITTHPVRKYKRTKATPLAADAPPLPVSPKAPKPVPRAHRGHRRGHGGHH